MPKKSPPRVCAANPDAVLDALQSEDELTRAKAVSSVCPCRTDWNTYERYRSLVLKMQKDPSPTVRKTALHVLQDSLEADGSGLQTSPQEITNEMAATRRRMRFQKEESELADRLLQEQQRKEREKERERKRETTAVFGKRRNSPIKK